MSEARTPAYVVYDGECPFCTSFAKLVRLREAVGPVELVNARDDHPVVRRLERDGYDLDEGMAFVWREEVFHGDAAVQRLALLSSPVGPFNRLNRWIFSDAARTRALYPWLRAGRNAALALLGRRRIADSAPRRSA